MRTAEAGPGSEGVGIRTTQILLADGDNLWDKLKERTPELAYTEEELVRHREILAFIAQANNIWDFRAVPAGRLTVPSRASAAAVIAYVRTHPQRYREVLAVVEQDRALGL
jgi:hypothetical protein